MKLLTLVIAVATAHPVSRHVGLWTKPPERCPSSMVTDGPILGNGDLGAAVGGVVNGGVSFYLATPAQFWAAQILESARVNFSVSYSNAPTINASAIIVAEENVLVARLSVDGDAILDVTVVVNNPMDLPLAAAHSAHALTVQRAANSWEHGQQVYICPVMTKHPLYGDNVIGSQVCSPTVTDNDINDGSDDDGGADDWRFQPEDGTVRRSNNRHLCMAYYTTAPPSTAGTSSTQFNQMVLRAVNCSAASPSHSTASSSRTPSPPLPRQQQSTRFSIISSGSLPEGGSSMLKAIDMDNKTSPCGSGCSSRFVEPNLNITMGIATWLFDATNAPLDAIDVRIATNPAAADDVFKKKRSNASRGSTNTDAPPIPPPPSTAITASFRLSRGIEYVLKTAVETTRPPTPIAAVSAVQAACNVISNASATTPQREADSLAWWSRWWNMSSIDLGPNRTLLESYYYGAHYMLGSFSHVGGLTAGLLGPWSLLDPVGWFDDLTLDYNVEANYWAMKPYFATMDAMVPLCERRARLSTWGHGGHGSNVAFGQQTDMMGCGPEGWSVISLLKSTQLRRCVTKAMQEQNPTRLA
eukprot:gene8806-28885_t